MLQVASRTGHLGGWWVDLDTRLCHWSDEVCRIHGMPPGFQPDLAEAIGFAAPEYRERLAAAFEACATSGRPYDEEAEIIDYSGDRVWVRTSGRAVWGGGGRIIRVEGAFQDISAWKAAESELALSQQRFNELADTMPMTVWVAGADGAVSFFNRSLIDFTGAPRETLLESGWLAVVHPDDRGQIRDQWQNALARQDEYRTEFRIRRHDGVYIWHLVRALPVFDSRGQVLRWYGTALDIQEQVERSRQYQALADRLQNILESIGDAFMSLDDEWRFTYCNTQAEKMARHSLAQLQGQSLWEVFPELVGTEVETVYRRAQREQSRQTLEYYYEPFGIWVELRVYPGRDGISVYAQDVSERHRLQEQLQRSQRLEAVGQLTGGMAHDFNNLLTVIMGNAEALSEQLAGDSRLHPLANMISSAADRGAELTRRLLAFARRQPLAPSAVDINQLITGLEELLRRTLGEHIELEWVRSPGLWLAMVDESQLESALLNLAINARDAMPTGGRLTIETANTRLDDVYAHQHGELAPGQYVLVAISDTGTGIEPGELQKVFEPFYTTKEKGKGTGLGLSMVFGFVKQSGGHITIYSEPGEGTTVKMYLPRAQATETLHGPVDGDTPVPETGNELILLVEDDELVRDYASNILAGAGYRVISAEDGNRALAILRQRSDIDLLFTDVVMPGGISGRQLADEAQFLHPGLKVVYTSGYTENAIVHHGRLDPGVQLLSKPYRREELLDKLRTVLNGEDHDRG